MVINKNGYCRIIFDSGDYYIGICKNSNFFGNGKYVYADQTNLQGIFDGDKFQNESKSK